MTAVVHGATGKVTTGFSFPYVATYSESSGTITYSNAQELARGVSVSIAPDTPDDNNFWANNQLAESGTKRFRSGTATLTVDGLLLAARKLIQGLPTAGDDGWTAIGDSVNVPYVGIGFIVRYMSGGVESWTPMVLVKARFNIPQDAATTEGEDGIDWQTQELTAQLYRGDNANHDWKWIGADFDAEADALAALKTKLGIVLTPVDTSVNT